MSPNDETFTRPTSCTVPEPEKVEPTGYLRRRGRRPCSSWDSLIRVASLVLYTRTGWKDTARPLHPADEYI
ncbi:hypothetical protein GDO81_022506 [Engystomops pustulosus]|uniref:Uncharacterized protein n=1 Tax=Engystomops pustulosus TaxID=76066 RepID=A0AAV6YPD8_ENGPU|nr:hypothetical protein GDO81_022506 [Engystomops pustulosus]